jgi:hypothetical protein
MNKRFTSVGACIALAMASGLATAGTVSVPAASLKLPDDITATVRPANAAHPNLAASAVIALTPAADPTAPPVELTLSCVPAFGQLAKKDGMERLLAATLQVDKSVKLDKPGEWIEIGGLPAYYTDASRKDGTRLTQWMIPRGPKFAWLKFDRSPTSVLENDVLASIAGMKVLCGDAPAEAGR